MKKTEIDALKALLEGNSIPSSRLGESLRQSLMQEHLLISISHGSRVSYRTTSTDALRKFIGPLPVEALPTRAQQVEEYGDSKAFRTRSCPGFPVNSYEPIRAELNGKPIIIQPDEGSFLFISDWQTFRIDREVIVIGVENMENFRFIRSQRHLFEGLCAPILFASRYPQSGDLVEWLKSIPNRYIHFGDLDLAGIHIFLNEFRKHLGERASFFIPMDAEARLATGNRQLYDAQIAHFGRMNVSDPRLQFLVDLIHKHQRGYEQEGFIDIE